MDNYFFTNLVLFILLFLLYIILYVCCDEMLKDCLTTGTYELP